MADERVKAAAAGALAEVEKMLKEVGLPALQTFGPYSAGNYRIIAAALSAADAVSAGTVLPEITREMMDAGQKYLDSIVFDRSFELPVSFRWVEFWSAMLSASSSIPLLTEEEVRADEREKCAKIVDNLAANEEAERRAVVVDNPFAAAFCHSSDISFLRGMKASAAAIRKGDKG